MNLARTRLALLLLTALGSASCIVPVRAGYGPVRIRHRHAPRYHAPRPCPPPITLGAVIPVAEVRERSA